VIDDAELAAAIADRPHWQPDEHGAVYAPPGVSAHVRLRPVQAPARASGRYHGAIVSGQIAVYSTPLASAVAGVRWAERTRLT
jgi:hypothetical protein